MRIAIPTIERVLSPHFGQASHLEIMMVDADTLTIASHEVLRMPPHTPGALPRFIAEQEPDVVIASSIGERAVIMLADAGIPVVAGAPSIPAQVAAIAYLKNELPLTANACEHGHDHEHGHDRGNGQSCGHDH